MYSQKLDFSSSYHIKEPIALFDGLVHKREIIIIKGITSQQKYWFVWWNRSYKLPYRIAIITSVIRIKLQFCFHFRTERVYIFLNLWFIALYEMRGQRNQRFSKSVCGFNLIYFCCSKVFGELIEKSHITSRKTIYGLPVIAYAIQLCWWISLTQHF